jgi:hypothetical protein
MKYICYIIVSIFSFFLSKEKMDNNIFFTLFSFGHTNKFLLPHGLLLCATKIIECSFSYLSF